MGRRRLLALAASAPIGALLSGCLGSADSGDVQVLRDGTPVGSDVTGTPAPATSSPGEVAPFSPTPYRSNLDPEALSGFTVPIAGACLPSRDEVMPNAPRTYRNGVHEGVDFYHGDVCTPIEHGLEVLAMHRGVVTRADHGYEDLTAADVEALDAKTEQQGFSDPETLDIYRGRQVWVDHGNGVATRYCHLSGIADRIDVGVEVGGGDVIGYVGESGTPESVTAPGTEIHLHAEVRIGDSFLGAGLPPAEVRALYERLFGPPDAA